MRLILAVLLAFGLLLNGHASLSFGEFVCPMQASMGAPLVHADFGAISDEVIDASLDEASDDCCVDAETFARTGDPCKSGQTCQAGNLMVLSPTSSPFASRTSATIIDREPFLLPAVRADSVWRPPASIQSRC